MRPNDGKEKDLENDDLIGNYKYDGTYGVLFKEQLQVELWGRSWKNDFIPKHPHIGEELKNLPWDSCILSGELCFFDKNGKDSFLTGLASLSTSEERGLVSKYVIFDILEADGEDYTSVRYEDRINILSEIKNTEHVFVAPVYRGTEAKKALFATCNEGIVLKHKDSYISDGRTSLWKKLKKLVSDDFWCIGLTKGTGRREATFGAMLLAKKTGDKYKYNTGDIFTYVGKTSGFSDKHLAKYLKVLKPIKEGTLTISEPKTPKNRLPKNIQAMVYPDTLVEIKYQRWTEYDMLLMPRFIKERDDLV